MIRETGAGSGYTLGEGHTERTVRLRERLNTISQDIDRIQAELEQDAADMSAMRADRATDPQMLEAAAARYQAKWDRSLALREERHQLEGEHAVSRTLPPQPDEEVHSEKTVRLREKLTSLHARLENLLAELKARSEEMQRLREAPDQYMRLQAAQRAFNERWNNNIELREEIHKVEGEYLMSRMNDQNGETRSRLRGAQAAWGA